MHELPVLNPGYPVFQGALHDYAKISTANAFPRAVAIVEHDKEPEPELGPTWRSASMYEDPRDEG